MIDVQSLYEDVSDMLNDADARQMSEAEQCNCISTDRS